MNPCPRGHEIYNFARPYLGHLCYILSLSEQCLWVEKKIFKEKHQFYTFFTLKLPPLGMGGGSRNFQFPLFLPYRCYIPNVVKIGPVVLEKKMLRDNARQSMPTNSNSPK